jgi:hypothetical protein
MKKLLAIILTTSIPLITFCSAANAAPTVLSNYTQVVDALKHGNNVRAIYTLDNCKLVSSKLNSGKKSDNASGDFVGIDYSMFSNTHWTFDGKAKNGIVTSLTEVSKFENYNYRSYTSKAFEDNTAELTMTIAKQPSGEMVKSSTFICTLGKDTSQSGAVFYAVS